MRKNCAYFLKPTEEGFYAHTVQQLNFSVWFVPSVLDRQPCVSQAYEDELKQVHARLQMAEDTAMSSVRNESHTIGQIQTFKNRKQKANKLNKQCYPPKKGANGKALKRRGFSFRKRLMVLKA
eukprot:5997449-Amphidinium_carterae.1